MYPAQGVPSAEFCKLTSRDINHESHPDEGQDLSLNGAEMRPVLIAFLTLSVACLHQGQSQTMTQGNPQPDGLEVFLKDQMRRRHLPGLQIAVVRRGEIVLLAAYGLANIQDSVPVTNHTVFAINSITKAFVGVAMMQLVEAGKLDLEAPVSRYLDSLPAAWQPVTIRQLLNHTSGLPSIFDNDQMISNDGEDAVWAKVIALPIEFTPGQRFRYNATNYLLLRRIIEKLTDRPFIQFIAERQLQVVGMPLTIFGDSHDVIPNSARDYNLRRGVDWTGHRVTLFDNIFEDFPPFFRAATGVYSTAGELVRWVIALQKGQLFKASTSLATLWTAGKLNDGSSAGFGRVLNGYALGWVTVNRPKHRAVASVGGARSALFIYPDDDLAVVILTNRKLSFPESFIEDVAAYYIPDIRASTGSDVPPTIKALNAELMKRGFEHLAEAVNELKRTDATFHLAEGDVNAWGYRLLGEDYTKQAIDVFKLNTSLYPQSANTYDSLAEGYDLAGETALAVRYYKRSLELNPKNTHAIEQLEQLEPGGAKAGAKSGQ
jgi:CubicO group peptidase (beta-lactamase class C family)